MAPVRLEVGGRHAMARGTSGSLLRVPLSLPCLCPSRQPSLFPTLLPHPHQYFQSSAELPFFHDVTVLTRVSGDTPEDTVDNTV